MMSAEKKTQIADDYRSNLIHQSVRWDRFREERDVVIKRYIKVKAKNARLRKIIAMADFYQKLKSLRVKIKRNRAKRNIIFSLVLYICRVRRKQIIFPNRSLEEKHRGYIRRTCCLHHMIRLPHVEKKAPIVLFKFFNWVHALGQLKTLIIARLEQIIYF
jgi:hypothetical protein